MGVQKAGALRVGMKDARVGTCSETLRSQFDLLGFLIIKGCCLHTYITLFLIYWYYSILLFPFVCVKYNSSFSTLTNLYFRGPCNY